MDLHEHVHYTESEVLGVHVSQLWVQVEHVTDMVKFLDKVDVFEYFLALKSRVFIGLVELRENLCQVNVEP
jgi:hypothetical protein